MKRKIACLLAQGFQDDEFRAPLDALTHAGFDVDIIGLEAGQQLQGKDGRETALTGLSIEQASVVNYAGLLIPGGKSPENLRDDERVLKFVREFDSSKKPIAAICHGPQLLSRANLVKDRTLTAYKDVHEELRQQGAKVVDSAVVSDGNWITSRQPSDLPMFCDAFVTQLDTNCDQSWMARGDVHPEEPRA